MNGSYTTPGTVDPSHIDWDFDYDGQTFDADASAHGTLTPNHTYYSVNPELTDRAAAA